MTEFRQTDATAKDFRPISLDAINFLLADVRGALGPYLTIFLVTRQHWSLSEVGLVTTVGGLIGLALQTPAGALIDSTRAKRGFVVAALAVLATGATIIALWPGFWPVLIANSLVAVVGDIFGPAIAALTLGLVARKQLARRIGRNSAFDHAGNVVIAALAGLVGWALSQRAVFFRACCARRPVRSGAGHRPREGEGPRQEERGGRREPVQLEGAPGMPATAHLCRLRNAVPFRERAASAARRPEARLSASEARDGHDGVVHYRCADDYATDSTRRRLQGRHLGPKAVVPRWLRHLADPRLPLHALRRQRLAHWRAIDGWRGCGHLRSAHAARASGPHARHGPLQRRSRGCCDRPRHRCLGERSCRRRNRRPFRLFGGVRDFGHFRPRCARGLLLRHARDRAQVRRTRAATGH